MSVLGPLQSETGHQIAIMRFCDSADEFMGDEMSKKKTLLLWGLGSALLMFSYQNCSPTNFSQFEEPSIVMPGAFFKMNSQSVRSPRPTSDVKEIDWNQNGMMDVVFAHSQEGRYGQLHLSELCLDIEIHQMNKCFPLGAVGDEAIVTKLAVADLDKDGRPDIVEFRSGKAITSSVIYNRGGTETTGPIFEKRSFYTHSASNSQRLTGDLIDFDRDGDLDIAFIPMVMAVCLQRDTPSGPCVRYGQKWDDSGSPVTLDLRIAVNTNGAFNSIESFELPNTYKFNQDPNSIFKNLKLERFNDKLYATNDRFEDHYILSFESPRSLSLKKILKSESHRQGNYWSSVLIDLDNDGKIEALHLCGSCSKEVGSIVYSLETSRPAYTIPSATWVWGMTLVDMHNDGRKDLVGTKFDFSTQKYMLYVWENIGSHNWSEGKKFEDLRNPVNEMGAPFLVLKDRRGNFSGLLLGSLKEDIMWTPEIE